MRKKKRIVPVRMFAFAISGFGIAKHTMCEVSSTNNLKRIISRLIKNDFTYKHSGVPLVGMDMGDSWGTRCLYEVVVTTEKDSGVIGYTNYPPEFPVTRQEGRS